MFVYFLTNFKLYQVVSSGGLGYGPRGGRGRGKEVLCWYAEGELWEMSICVLCVFSELQPGPDSE